MSNALAELEAMKKVAEAIDKLEAEARARVLGWAVDHYSVGSVKAKSMADPINPEKGRADEPVLQQGYDSISELFADAQPRSDAEKALVAGYWLQVEAGNTDFGTQEVNSELKHLGYGVGNITRAFDTLKTTRPQQVIQLRKAGTSKQARKTFKVTEAGKKVVEAMIRNSD